MIYVRQDMEGRAFWFHVTQLLNGRYQRELSENYGTAQRASCQTAFKRGSRTEERQPHPPAGTRTGAPAVTTAHNDNYSPSAVMR